MTVLFHDQTDVTILLNNNLHGLFQDKRDDSVVLLVEPEEKVIKKIY